MRRVRGHVPARRAAHGHGKQSVRRLSRRLPGLLCLPMGLQVRSVARAAALAGVLSKTVHGDVECRRIGKKAKTLQQIFFYTAPVFETRELSTADFC